jgi:hypothetical protein
MPGAFFIATVHRQAPGGKYGIGQVVSSSAAQDLTGLRTHLLELLALAVLAGFGCGFALARIFVGIFAAASAVTIIEAIGRSR